MIPLSVPNLTGKEAEYLQECVRTNFVSTAGPFVTRFEAMVSKASGGTDAAATASGTDGIHLALMSVGAAPGDLVIIPSFTFIATANAVAHCGAEPWLLDVDLASWTLDPDLLRRTLQEETRVESGNLFHKPSGKRIAAVMPVYTLGMPADMDRIAEIAGSFRLPVVADAAPALGARYRGKNLGGLSDLTVFSFNGNKTVTCGGGGAVVGKDKIRVDRVRHLASTARVGSEYEHDAVGFNYRMTNLEAAVGCAQLERLEEFVSAKRRIRSVYEKELASTGVGFFPRPEWAESSDWFPAITLDDPSLPRPEEVSRKLREKGIDARGFWKPVHLQKPYKNSPRTPLKISEQLWERVIVLPSSTSLSQQDQQTVIRALREVLGKVEVGGAVR